MPEKLLVPFNDKGKQVSVCFSFEVVTGTEIQNRKNSPGPMGTGSVTSVSGTGSIACGHQKVSIRSYAIIAQP